MAGARLWLLLAESGARVNELRALDPGDGHVTARLTLSTDDAIAISPAGKTPTVTTQSGELISVRPPP